MVPILESAIMIAGVVVMTAVCIGWVALIANSKSFSKHLPSLECPEYKSKLPKVSVIVPARDEEDFIGLCLRTLVKQDYPDYEIILVDHRSEDTTYSIMWSFAQKYPNRIKIIRAGKEPKGWAGKTWACECGRKEATGEMLLFTDADTEHESDAMRLAINHMLANKMDVITLTQKIKTLEFWTRITMPAITGFKLAYPDGIVMFSAKTMNDPKKKHGGGLLGAYFVIKSKVYDETGGFASVKNAILEDWMLGRKLKKAGCSMRIVDGSSKVSAVWTRDLPTLDQAFGRLMAPMATNQKAGAVWSSMQLSLLLFSPYVVLPAVLVGLAVPAWLGNPVYWALVGASAAATVSHIVSYMVQAKSMGIQMRNTVFAPLAGLVASTGFANGLRGKAVWHEQEYQKSDMIEAE